MYGTHETLPVDSLEPGTSVLCRGPPLTGKRRLGLRVLAEGLAAGEAAVIVTTQQSGVELRAALADVSDSFDASKLAVVDCVAAQSGAEVVNDELNVSASSPADLTGIGMGLTDVLQRFEDRGIERVRLLFDSLSTLLMYADFERAYRFCHVLVQRIESIGGLGFVTVDSEAVPKQEGESLRGLFDAVVEVNVEDEESVYRFQREGEHTEWEPVLGVTAAEPSERAFESTPTDVTVQSLHELVERMSTTARTLTVFEPETPEELDDVRPFFERHNVAVETTSAPEGGPVDFAVLHRDGEFQAAEAMPILRDTVVLEDVEDAPKDDIVESTLIRRLETDVFSATGEPVREMVRISRSIERAAWEAGSGVIHAGFQRLSRLIDEWRTREVYDAIAARDVDVHLYGVPDNEEPLGDQFVIHDDDCEEIADSWFVLFEGPDGQRRGLVCEEQEKRRYTGFWTFDGDTVKAAVDYLERTY